MKQQRPVSDAQRRYRKFLRSTQFTVQRARIILRSGGICEVCHKAKVRQIHHLRYSDDIVTTPDNDLLATCGKCHRNLHAFVPTHAAGATTEIKLF